MKANIINSLGRQDGLLTHKNHYRIAIDTQERLRYFNEQIKHSNKLSPLEINELNYALTEGNLSDELQIEILNILSELLQYQTLPKSSLDIITTLTLDNKQLINKLAQDIINSVNNKIKEAQNRDSLNLIKDNQTRESDLVDIDLKKLKNLNSDLVKVIPVGIDTKVKIIFSENIKAFLIKQNQEIEIKYENLPEDLKKINTPELFNTLLKDAYIKLATYSDGDIKFYINQRLKGGGKGTDSNNQGVEEYNKGNYEKALEYFSRAISEDNNENIFKNNKSDALNQIGDKYYKNKEYPKAIEYYDQAYGATNKPESEALYLSNKAHALQNLERYDEAVQYFDRAYAKKPEQVYRDSKAFSLNQIGNKHRDNKEYIKAIEYYDKAYNTTNQSNSEASYLNNKANALYNLERYNEAIEYYDKAYAKKSDQVYKSNKANAYNALGDKLYNDNKFQEAIIQYDKAITVKSDKLYFFNKACAFNQLKCYKEAIESADKALSIDSNYSSAKDRKATALNAIAIELDNQGKYDDAIRYYDAAISVKNEAAYHSNKAGAYNSLKQYNKAIDSANRALELDSNHSYAKDKKTCALNQIGNSLYNEEKYEESIKKYDEAISIKPGEAAYYNNRGNALYKLQKYQESIPSYEKAIELNSNDTSYFNNKVLALALAVQKQRKNLSVQDNAFLKQALLSDDLLHKGVLCRKVRIFSQGVSSALQMRSTEDELILN